MNTNQRLEWAPFHMDFWGAPPAMQIFMHVQREWWNNQTDGFKTIAKEGCKRRQIRICLEDEWSVPQAIHPRLEEKTKWFFALYRMFGVKAERFVKLFSHGTAVLNLDRWSATVFLEIHKRKHLSKSLVPPSTLMGRHLMDLHNAFVFQRNVLKKRGKNDVAALFIDEEFGQWLRAIWITQLGKNTLGVMTYALTEALKHFYPDEPFSFEYSESIPSIPVNASHSFAVFVYDKHITAISGSSTSEDKKEPSPSNFKEIICEWFDEKALPLLYPELSNCVIYLLVHASGVHFLWLSPFGAWTRSSTDLFDWVSDAHLLQDYSEITVRTMV